MTKDDSFTIKIGVRNSGLRGQIETIARGIPSVHLSTSDSKQRPDLLIFELGSDIEKHFSLLKSLIDSSQVGAVFIVGDNTDSRVLLRAIKTGIKEFFPLPIDADEVSKAIEKSIEEKQRSFKADNPKSGKVISVFGSKGGVGTTTIAVNLAAITSVYHPDKLVALIDMNLLFGEIPLFFNITPKYDWGEIAKNIDRLDATFLMNILTKHSTGVYILPSPNYMNGQYGVTFDIFKQLIGLMREVFDYIVVDGGQTINDAALNIAGISDKIYLVSILSLPCILNVSKVINFLADTGMGKDNQVEIIVNRHLRRSDIEIGEAEKIIKKKISWFVPNDYKTTVAAINQGKVLNELKPRSDVNKKLKEIVATLTAQKI